MIKQTRPISESIIHSQSESEFAHYRREAGDKIIKRKGQFWVESHFGFYQAANWLVRMPLAQAVPPAVFYWAYRTSLAQTDVAAANGTMPVNLLQDISRYDYEHLHSSCRYDLRKSRKLVTIVELTRPDLLYAEGYEVMRSAWSRWGNSFMPTKAAYLNDIARAYKTRRMILAGIADGKLLGYLVGYAVGSTAYIEFIFLATESLSTQIGTALVFDFIQTCRQSGVIREVSYGLCDREDPAEVAFKERMGFLLVQIPSIVYINPVMAEMLRWFKPHVFYRLTGRG